MVEIRRPMVSPLKLFGCSFALFGAIAPQLAVAQNAYWMFEKEADRITDQVGMIAVVEATEKGVYFGIQCDASKPDRPIYLIFRHQGKLTTDTYPRISMRFDGIDVRDDYWQTVTYKGMVLTGSGLVDKIVRRTASARSLLVRVYDNQSQSHDYDFVIGAPGPLFAEVYRTCGAPKRIVDRIPGADLPPPGPSKTVQVQPR